ncbi:MAG: transporter substrate-binding domain-containing protein [bacterium]|nr:transporter substrate-binding domain-containing protein [bacterium]
MNKIIILSVALFVLAGSPAYAQQQSRLHQILASGVLRVGTTGDWNPMSMRDPVGNAYTGFDIDVATELAKDLGVKVEFVPTDWKSIVNGIVADKYDMSSSASITTARIKTVGFTQAYFRLGTVPMTLRKNLAKFSSWEQIDRKEVTVAVTLGTSQEQQAKRFFSNAQVRSIEAPARDYQEVLVGRAMISLTSNLEASTLVETYPELAMVPVAPRSPADIAFMVGQHDFIWLNYLNHWISIKESHGFFDGLKAKWMPTE